MNKQIVRLLLKYTETMSHDGRLIQIIPNGYIEDIADEIEALVNKNSVIHGVIFWLFLWEGKEVNIFKIITFYSWYCNY